MLNSTTFCLQWLTLEWRNSSPAYCFYFQCCQNNTSFSSDKLDTYPRPLHRKGAFWSLYLILLPPSDTGKHSQTTSKRMPQGRSNESDPPQRYTVPVEIQQKKKGITISFWKNFKHCRSSNYDKFHGRVRNRNFFVFSSPLGLNVGNIQIGYNSNTIPTSVTTIISL